MISLSLYLPLWDVSEGDAGLLSSAAIPDLLEDVGNAAADVENPVFIVVVGVPVIVVVGAAILP
jgi:hypothetical protein